MGVAWRVSAERRAPEAEEEASQGAAPALRLAILGAWSLCHPPVRCQVRIGYSYGHSELASLLRYVVNHP